MCEKNKLILFTISNIIGFICGIILLIITSRYGIPSTVSQIFDLGNISLLFIACILFMLVFLMLAIINGCKVLIESFNTDDYYSSYNSIYIEPKFKWLIVAFILIDLLSVLLIVKYYSFMIFVIILLIIIFAPNYSSKK